MGTRSTTSMWRRASRAWLNTSWRSMGVTLAGSMSLLHHSTHSQAATKASNTGIVFEKSERIHSALRAKYDTYGGVLVDPVSVESCSTTREFDTALRSSVSSWRAAGKR